MYNLKEALNEYAQNGAQQTLVIVGAITALGAYMNYRQGLPLYGSMSRAPSQWNNFVAKRGPQLGSPGMSAPPAMKQAADEFHS
jgi:hypothetical protein